MSRKIKWPRRDRGGNRIKERSEIQKYPRSSKKWLPVQIEDFATKDPVRLAQLRKELAEHKKRLDAVSDVKLFLSQEKLRQRDRELTKNIAKKMLSEMEKRPPSEVLLWKVKKWREEMKGKPLSQLEGIVVRCNREINKYRRAMFQVEQIDWIKTNENRLEEAILKRKLINEEIAKRGLS